MGKSPGMTWFGLLPLPISYCGNALFFWIRRLRKQVFTDLTFSPLTFFGCAPTPDAALIQTFDGSPIFDYMLSFRPPLDSPQALPPLP